MLSPESLEAYRRMTNSERLKLTLQMIDENLPYLYRGTPEQVRRRIERINRENEERNRLMLTAIARTRKKDE
ncbi:MAG: hypothetical protein IT426_08670 [Pirellulales bacterium]|nr:hypothetical protein [Pirellulales bacterium]